MEFFKLLKYWWQYSWDRFVYHSKYCVERHVVFGVTGAVAFPVYGVVWTYLQPQPYENPYLRIVLSFSWIMFALLEYWPVRSRRVFAIYWWWISLMSLPFFFTFMGLANGMNPAWSMSYVGALVILVLLADIRSALIQQVVGTFLGTVVFFVLFGLEGFAVVSSSASVYELLYVMIFVISGVAIFNISRLIDVAKSESTVNVGRRMAHELRTPLKSIENYSSRSLGSSVDVRVCKAVRRDLMAIAKEARHCLLTIELFQASAKAIEIDSGREVVSLRDVVNESINSISRYPGQKCWFLISGSGDLSLCVQPSVLRHLIDNLLVNAVYAVKQADRCGGARIEISFDPIGLSFDVSDNGCGIKKSTIPRIFESFYTTKPTGTGLGLPYCKEVVESLGGRIACESTIDVGTTFRVEFSRSSGLVFGSGEAGASSAA